MEPEPLATGRPVEIRSAALAVLAVPAIVMMLQYAQSAIYSDRPRRADHDALEPIVARMTVRRVPRPIAAAIVLIGVTAAVGSCCTAFERKRPRSSISCRTRRSGCGGWSKAVPMLMILKVVCDHIEDFKGVGELLGE